jgi:Protein of unknown function (DUF2637)
MAVRAHRVDRIVRWSTAAAVVEVAAVAAYISYWHAHDVVRAHGEDAGTALLLPLTVDGLVFASSMVLLHSARHRLPVPPLARWLLLLGIAATLAANVAHGAGHGPIGALVAAWPAAALVGSYELLMWLIRTAPERTTAQTTEVVRGPRASAGRGANRTAGPRTGPSRSGPAGADRVDDEARAAYRTSLTNGVPLSERTLANRYGRGRTWARRIRIEAAGDGHRPGHLHAVPADATGKSRGNG